MKYDLHCHSTFSDGALPPADLVQRAQQQGVTHLALTDHDTLSGLSEAHAAAQTANITLINGIELSVLYNSQCFHVLGLNFDAESEVLLQGLHRQQQLRANRAHKIAEKLAKKRIFGVYEAVCEAAGDKMITRLHFAQFLVAHGYANDLQAAFDKYLAQGKLAYVATRWIDMEEGVAWIKAAGGVAVLAHPLRYPLTGSRLNRALVAFKLAGGHALEVVTGRSSPDDINYSQRLADKYGFSSSVGSDFHDPAHQWPELGKTAPLPNGAKAVWELF